MTFTTHIHDVKPGWSEVSSDTKDGWEIRIQGSKLTESGRAFALADLIENTPNALIFPNMHPVTGKF